MLQSMLRPGSYRALPLRASGLAGFDFVTLGPRLYLSPNGRNTLVTATLTLAATFMT
jgi:hypothetical protein